MKKLIPLSEATDEQIATCAKHCGLDEIPLCAKAMEVKTKADRDLLIKYLTGGGYAKVDVTDPDCIMPVKATNKDELVAQINELRKSKDMPPIDGSNLTNKQLEDLAYNLENPSGDPRPAAKAVPMPELLKRLNAILAKQGKPVLKSWKASRAALEERLAKASASRDHVKVQQVPEAKANGKKKPGKVHKKITTHLKKEDAELDKIGGTPAQIAEARRVNAQTGFSVANVLRFILKHKTVVFSRHVAKAEKQLIREWLGEDAPKAKAKKERGTSKARAPKADCLSPADLAEALGKDPRAVRIILRKKEGDIPKAWRVEGERWSFKPEHKDDVLKLLKGGK